MGLKTFLRGLTMPIKYVLRKNNLVEEPDIYAASVRISGSAGLEEIADRIVDQGTTVRRADVLAVLENAINVTDTMLMDGFRVNFGGLCDLFPKIKGSFEGPTDIYDPSRHQVDVGAMPGRRVRSTIREQASVERQEVTKPVPDLVKFSKTGDTGNEKASPSPTIATINGYRLKFDPAKEDEGIFFVATSDGTATRIDPSKIQRNKPSQLVFLTPELSSGTYYIEVRTRYTEDGELRIGRLDGPVNP